MSFKFEKVRKKLLLQFAKQSKIHRETFGKHQRRGQGLDKFRETIQSMGKHQRIGQRKFSGFFDGKNVEESLEKNDFLEKRFIGKC